MSENTSLREGLKTLATAMYADGDEWNAYDLLLDAADALSTPPAEGMVLVPRVPTIAMVEAILREGAGNTLGDCCHEWFPHDREQARELYAAMIAATEGSNG